MVASEITRFSWGFPLLFNYVSGRKDDEKLSLIEVMDNMQLVQMVLGMVWGYAK